MNPGLPTVEPWAHLLWINQTKFCTGGLFFSFFNQVILILPYLIFIIMLVPFSNGVKISLPPEALHGQVWIFKPRRNLEHPTFASELCDNNCFYFLEQAKPQRVLQNIRCVPPQCLLMEPC